MKGTKKMNDLRRHELKYAIALMLRMTTGLLPGYKGKNVSTHKHANLDFTFKSTS